MASSTESGATRRIGDAAVKAGTGRNWREWFSLLDRAGAAKLDHRSIVALLVKEMPSVDGWWQQCVTVTYEQARGLRERHQKAGGFEVSASRTIAAPVARLFQAWTDDRLRAHWLEDAPLVVHKSTPTKSLRASWKGAKCISVNFYAKGAGRTQIAMQHGKLPDGRAAVRMKRFWRERLDALAEAVA